MAAVIHTDKLAVSFDGETPIFEDLDLVIDKGEFVTLVGVSGAGKSTLLRVIADLIPPFRGQVSVDAPQTGAKRPIAMVFQAANLMPWRRVRDNITLGLEGIDVSPAEKEERVQRTLKLVGLEGYADRWPYQLSGGQQQRIGIARALAVDPDILLMDEPFGALDAITRTGLQDELLRIWQETGKSVLFVTHDIEEAVYLGDRVLLLGGKPARIVEEYKVDIPRKSRRESAAFVKMTDRVRSGLQKAIAETEA
ncbi:MAG: ABC transporter ATP-binding protein [Alphaproteobacteria bacterium]|nr:MAG: ABC transporter ATP-binding protein [Alphaproteobacteria bacterium]